MPLPSPGTEIRRARPLLGTLVEIAVTAGWLEARVHAAVDAAFAEVERVHRLMSFHNPDSDVSRLNQRAWLEPCCVDPRTHEVLAAALELSRQSDGAFDVSIAVQLQDWGFLPGVTDANMRGACWSDIELPDSRSVRFKRPLRIDLGGIAKGYAVDRAIAALHDAGVTQAIVNAGGDLRATGPAPQRVLLRHPENPSLVVGDVLLENEALATSANYYSLRSHAIGEVSPLLDPRSRRPWLGKTSVSVRAPDCLSADALTKVVLFASPELAEQVLEERGAQACLLGSPSPAGIAA